MDKRISLRFNLVKLEHQAAWNILSQLPNGRMNEYIVHSIIKASNHESLKLLLADTMVEVMENYDFSKSKVNNEADKKIDNEAMNFISQL